MQIVKTVILLSLLTTLAACGNKGPVRPLEVPQPNTVQAPELRQQGEALLLGWQLPTTHQNGTPFSQPPVVDIYRMTYDPQDECPECFDRSSLLARINPELPEPALKIGKRYFLFDRPLQVGTGYQYKLIVRSDADETSRPTILRQAFGEPVAAPEQVSVTPKDGALLLQWTAPALTAGDTLIGYLVYRRVDAQSSPYPVTPQPLQETEFEDFGLNNDTSYHYRVRALVQRGEQQIEGIASAEITASPKEEI